MRLAAQRLAPGSGAVSAERAASAVCGVQAQDVRAAGLALRARTPGLTRAGVDAAPLVRTWTARGTAHLVPVADRDWMHAVFAPRLLPRFAGLLDRRGALDAARALLPALVDLLDEGPLPRSAALAALAERGHAVPAQDGVNVLVPWATQVGVVSGLPDGRLRSADPPGTVERDAALATLARRYLAGYGPASEADLAWWSGLPGPDVRRAIAAAGDLERAGELLALPGTLEAEPPPSPPASLLAAYDTAMLGYRARDLLVPRRHAARVAPGGGVVRAAVLARGVAAGVWRLPATGSPRLDVEWFGRPPARAALDAEHRDVVRFLRGGASAGAAAVEGR